MPVYRIEKAPESPHYLKLVDELAKELKRDRQSGPKGAPEIYEEVEDRDFLNITVIWNKWKDVGGEERGNIIMDAYEKQRPEDVGKIMVALGLTRQEADRLGMSEELRGKKKD